MSAVAAAPACRNGQLRKAVGGRLRSLMRPALRRCLRDSLPTEADLRLGTALIGVDDRDDRVVVTLDDGATLKADLLVGADGDPFDGAPPRVR